MTMDQIDLEINPPKDRLNIVYFIMVLHGIGTLISWNMFITATTYFLDFKLLSSTETKYKAAFQEESALAAQIPNLIFSWLNLFVQLGGNLTTRIVWGIFVQVVIFLFTIVLAMTDTTNWIKEFYWTTIITVIILNTANGIYQNSVYGMAAKLPGKYTGAVVLGSNISGTFVSVIDLVSKILSPNQRTAAIYYFITALFILLACFDTYFALPINRFYRYHELLAEKDANKKRIGGKAKGKSQSPPYFKVFKQCWVQCFNVFFIFFVTLTLFPNVQSNIRQSDPNFVLPKDYYATVMCFLVFNVTAMIGSAFGSKFQLVSKKYVIIPILLRALFIPLFLVCNYQIDKVQRTLPVYIDNDWIFLALGVAMGFTSGYFSSLAMMFCPSTVEPQYASTAGMFGAASLITGVVSGLTFAPFVSKVISWSIFQNM